MLAVEIIDNNSDQDVLMLHGIMADHYQLEYFWKLPYNIIAPDLPGHGESPAPKRHIIKNAAEEIMRFLKQERKQHLHVLAYSLGGYILEEMLRIGFHPRSIVFLSSAYEYPYDSILNKLMNIDIAVESLEKHQLAMETIMDEYRSIHGFEDVKTAGHLDVFATLRYVSELKKINNIELCRHINRPVMVIHGHKDKIIPVRHGKDLAKSIKGSQMKLLEKDHNNILRCDKTLKIIKDFFSKH